MKFKFELDEIATLPKPDGEIFVRITVRLYNPDTKKRIYYVDGIDYAFEEQELIKWKSEKK
jgi:hypothetical protein